MENLGIIFLFIVMLAAPCIIAARSSGRQKHGNDPYGEAYDDQDALEEPELHIGLPEDAPGLTAPVTSRLPPAVTTMQSAERPLTLSELADRAENDARIAQVLAHEAHYAALSAAAHAARLRADAAIEAARLAEKAIREAPLNFQGDYFVTQLSAAEAKAASRAA